MACFPSQLLELSNTSSWSNPPIEAIVAIVSLGWMLHLLTQRVLAVGRNRTNRCYGSDKLLDQGKRKAFQISHGGTKAVRVTQPTVVHFFLLFTQSW